MAILDRHKRVWVPSDEASDMFLLAQAVVKEFEDLDGADLFENEGFEDLRGKVARLSVLVDKVDSL